MDGLRFYLAGVSAFGTLFGMAKPAKKQDDHRLFEKAPEHLRKLNEQARKGLREDERRKWKEQNAHNDAAN